MDIIAAPGPRSLGIRRGLSVFCDVTIVSPLTRRGAPRSGARHTDGAVLSAATRKKHARYADVSGSDIAAFVVLGCEVYGRWGNEAHDLVKDLTVKKAADAPRVLRQSARIAWLTRWWNVVSVGVQRAIGESLFCPNGPDLIGASPLADSPPPLMDIISD